MLAIEQELARRKEVETMQGVPDHDCKSNVHETEHRCNWCGKPVDSER